jgi:hypothetical protein
VGGESASPSPSSGPPLGWRNALLADYRQACADGDLQASALAGMTYAQASRYVDGLIGACQAEKPSKPPGHGPKHGHGRKKD